MDGDDLCDRVLVPTDGSDGATAALEHGLELAQRFDADVYILSVVNPYALSTVEERREREERAESVVAEAAARVREAGVSAETSVEAGFPHRVILDAVEETDADAVAMGTHGRTGLQHYLVGSVAEKVVRLSPVPVLTVRYETDADHPYENVLVPTDGSEAAEPAERWGVDLAAAFGADLRALSVVNEVRLPDGDAERALTNRARAAADAVVDEATAAGVQASGHVATGVPHREILDFCESEHADLIVMGTHGRTGVERFVLGSVAEKVLRLSDVPVLVVPSGDRT
jgi:nucleotide-binding universal stress UspA family protein